MAIAGEAAHVDADLGNEDFRRPLIHPGNRIEALHRVGEGGQERRNALAERGYRSFEVVEMRQDLSRQKGVVRAEVTRERLPQGWEFGPHAATCQLSQDRGIARALHQGFQHGAPRGPKDIPGHGRQLDAGVFQQLMDTIGFARSLLDERFPIAREPRFIVHPLRKCPES
jgi:hypothetical protein